MKLATFKIGGERHIGRVDLDQMCVYPFDVSLYEASRGVTALIGRAQMPREKEPLDLARIRLEAPVPRPARNIFCVGKNYHAHAREFAQSGFDSSAASGDIPEHPIIFSKVPECVVGPEDAVVIDKSVSEAIDYEAELAVIMGVGGRGISASDAMDHIWGYTIVNDVTARDLQGRHSQWLIGKSQDTFCPMGPWVVTTDDVDFSKMVVRCTVNGELRQSAPVADLIFDIPTLISTLSAGLTLNPGDIIATGTPVGVGIGFSPPKYLVPGDVVRVEIDQIGYLQNEMVAK
ncbi:fumarylacetoacetate hydrolase family protein [Roseobacter sp. EG26]|uniref:fumarylacetoacetate hydrolase family protein n=1 Tax=Roseobacter sp. EG26 TaxID=3412477 RepID=UPI003CE59619